MLYIFMGMYGILWEIMGMYGKVSLPGSHTLSYSLITALAKNSAQNQ